MCVALQELANKRRKIPESEYSDGPEGLKYYDITVGNGAEARAGQRVAVHIDVKWRNITFMTSRWTWSARWNVCVLQIQQAAAVHSLCSCSSYIHVVASDLIMGEEGLIGYYVSNTSWAFVNGAAASSNSLKHQTTSNVSGPEARAALTEATCDQCTQLVR